MISSLSPAFTIVLTRASTPPTWQTVTLFLWLLHVRLDKMPAAHVTTLTSLEANSCTNDCNNPSSPSTLVPASDRLRKVHKQFCTSRWLGWPKCIANACIPPASTMAGLLLEHTDKTVTIDTKIIYKLGFHTQTLIK